MNNSDKKLIVFKDDVDFVNKEKTYVKFLDEDKHYAIFYAPLIAPSNLKSYVLENEIHEAYLINDYKTLTDNINNVYTFLKNAGVYEVTKGLTKEVNYVLLVDYGMQIDLSLPRFSYKFVDDCIYLSNYKKNKNGYCYVSKDDVNDNLKKIMIKTESVIPGVLSLNKIDLDESFKRVLKRK